MDGARELIHATAIALAGRAALIRGPSGSGKSDLALRCLAAAPSPLVPQRAALVSDDQVEIERTASGRLWAHPPPAISGQIEVRGIGIVTLEADALAQVTEVALVVDLVAADAIERFPLNEAPATLLGIQVPLIKVAPFEASAPAKVLIALYFGLPPTGA